MGEYLGKQFEPVQFAGSSHNIKFYDIESKLFFTEEDRQIYLSDLSQGQSKITSLVSSLKQLKQGKKGIVLIDEIADLDAENLQSIKEQLKEYYNKGQILLAVLVRPMSEFNPKSIEISGWA